MDRWTWCLLDLKDLESNSSMERKKKGNENDVAATQQQLSDTIARILHRNHGN